MRRSSPGTLISRAATVLASLVVTALLLELGLRVLDQHLMLYDVEMWKYAVRLKEQSPDPLLRHVHRPSSHARLMGVDVRINAHGLRDFEYDYEKRPGVYRILVLGDSITFGWGVPFAATYAKRLERLLNAHATAGHSYQVINSGVGNWNTAQEVEWLRHEGLRYEPDLILLGYFLNDAEPIISSPLPRSSWVYRSHLAVFVWTGWSKLRLLFDGTRQYRSYYAQLYAGDGWRACERALAELSHLAAHHHARTMAVLFPDLHDLDARRYPFRAVHGRVLEAAERSRIPMLDLFPVYENRAARDLVVAADDAHPNELAHALAADAIYDFLVTRYEPFAAPARRADATS